MIMSKHNQHYQNTLAFVNLIVINNNSRQTKFKNYGKASILFQLFFV